MHFMTPRATSFRSFNSGGSRSVIHEVADHHLMQEMIGSFMQNEKREKIERPQNYGFSSAILPWDKDTGEGAEAFMFFLGGNRSHPVVGNADDRRHRPRGLKPGENTQYDDIGQMTLLRRSATYVLTLDTPAQGQQQEQKRFVSVRHVEKDKQERPKPGGDAKQQEAEQKKQEDFKHEGKTVNSEVIVEKDKVTVVCYAAASGNPGQGAVVSKTVHNRDGSITIDCSTYRVNANTITLNGTVLLGGPSASIKVKGLGDLLAERVYFVPSGKDACCADAAIAALEARIAALEAAAD